VNYSTALIALYVTNRQLGAPQKQCILFVVGVVTSNSYTQCRVSPNNEQTECLSTAVCTVIASVCQVLSNVVNCNQTVPETEMWCITAKQRRTRLV